MSIDILQAIIQRRNYPVGVNSVESEIRYATDILNTDNDRAFLVFPSAVLNRSRIQTLQLRETIFRNWKVAGIFDVGGVFEPVTSIEFSVLVLERTEPQKVRFGVFTGRAFAAYRRKIRRDGSLGELPPISESYRNYLTSIEQIVSTGTLPKAQKDFNFYEIGATQFDDSQLNTRFYDPDLTENEEKIRREKWVRLEEIADVLLPQPTNQPARVLTAGNFEYPFPEHLSTNDSGTDITLRQGDILVSSTGISQAFLVTITPPDDVRPSRSLYVIRPRSELVTSH